MWLVVVEFMLIAFDLDGSTYASIVGFFVAMHNPVRKLHNPSDTVLFMERYGLMTTDSVGSKATPEQQADRVVLLCRSGPTPEH